MGARVETEVAGSRRRACVQQFAPYGSATLLPFFLMDDVGFKHRHGRK